MYVRAKEAFPLGDFSKFVVKDIPKEHRTASPDIATFLTDGMNQLPNDSQIQAIIGETDKAAVALGDLGMFAAVLSKRGIDINKRTPDLVKHLLALSDATGLPPRDNYYSYTETNFPGPYARTFTGHPEEHLMVFYNAQFCELFQPTIETLRELVQTPSWRSQALNDHTQAAANNLHETTRLMLSVRQNVSSEVFSASRKYTAPIDIKGAKWIDDEGKPTTLVTNVDADSNIALIDLLLYGIDDEQQKYLDKLYQFFPSHRRQIFEDLIGNGFSSVAERYPQMRDQIPVDFQEGVVDIFKQMWGWRSIHNSAISTHLRTKGKGKNPDDEGFEYDPKIHRLLLRSKKGYDAVRG